MSAAASLFGSSWICIAAVLAVFGDAFIPLIPDGTIVIAATLDTSSTHVSPLLLAPAVALASFSGDVILLKIARRASGWAQRRLDRRPGAAAATATVLEALETKRGRTILLFRFVSGGRTLLDLTAGTAPRRPRHYLRWSAVSSTVWATYIVGLGYLNAHTFNTSWLSFGVACLAATIVSVLIARVVRQQRRASRTAASSIPGTAAADAPEHPAAAHAAPETATAGAPGTATSAADDAVVPAA
jgi:membrane protein DedA with SNARE-associated domain